MSDHASPRGGARLPRVAIALVLALVSGGVLLAHATAEDAEAVDSQFEIEAFVVAHDDHVEWLVRTPLELTAAWNLPRRGRGFLDFEALQGAELDRVTADTAQMVGVTHDGDRLAVADGSVRFSPPRSRHFDDLHTAREHIGGSNAPDEEIFWNQGFLDARFTSEPVDAPEALAVVTGLSTNVQERTALLVSYLAADGNAVEYEARADEGPLMLAPGAARVWGRHLAAGLRAPVDSWGVLLFVVAAALPARGRLRSTAALAGAVLPGLLAGALTWRYTGLSEDRLVAEALPAVVGVGIVWAAARGLLAHRPARPGISVPVLSVPLGFAAASAMGPLVQFSHGTGLLETVGFTLGAAVTIAIVAGVVGGAAALMERDVRVCRYGPLVALLLLAHVGWYEVLTNGDAALVLTLLEIRMLEADQWWQVATVAMYTSVVLALAWAGWEARAYLRSHRRQEAPPDIDAAPPGDGPKVEDAAEEVLDDAR